MASFNGQNNNFCKSGTSTCGTDSLLTSSFGNYRSEVFYPYNVFSIVLFYFLKIFLSIILCIIPSGLSLFSVAC